MDRIGRRQPRRLCVGTAIAACLLVVSGAAAAQIFVEEQNNRTFSDDFGAQRHSLRRHWLVIPMGAGQQDAVLADLRNIDGRNNNAGHPEMGAAATGLTSWVGAGTGSDGAQLTAADRPNPRVVSNVVHRAHGSGANESRLSDFFWQWGQFLDHDIVLIGEATPHEAANIAVPAGDPMFDPAARGDAQIAFHRSDYIMDGDVRRPRNGITGWIDASNVYGSDPVRAQALRTNDGTGRMLVSAGNMLPFNDAGLANAGGPRADFFLAGDARANEQVGLTALHTVFMREHNRLARQFEISLANDGGFSDPSGDQIYQLARALVGAFMQKITYEEFLPLLLGPNALSPYRGYDPSADAGIANMFASAAYRFGHSAVGERILRLDANGREISAGHLALREAFFTPRRLIDEGGIAPVLRGLAAQAAQPVDPYIVEDLRSFLFGPPGAGGFDLAALNIQRGRDHGLPLYNEAREIMGLRRAENFADITSDVERQMRLAAVYDDPDAVDLWVGGLAEDPVNGGQVGELCFFVLKRQFEALRDGDHNWYERVLSGPALAYVKDTSLAHIIRMNTEIGSEIADDVFHVPLAAELVSHPAAP